MNPAPIYILGAGAMGCLWASALHRHKLPYHLLLSSPLRATQLKSQGLIFESHMGDESFTAFPQYSLVNEPCDPIDYLIVATKAMHAADALHQFKKSIQDQTSIVLLQNGMGSQQTIAKQFPDNAIYCAITTEGAFTKQAFHVTHAGSGVTKIGCLQTSKTSHDDTALIKKLTTPYLQVKHIHNVEQALWHKLTINAAINAYTVVYNCKNGALLNHTEAMARIQLCCSELAQLSHVFHYHQTTEEIFKQVRNVLTLTADNYSSMLQDINNKKPTEIDFINGYVVNIAKENKTPYLENERLVNYIKNTETMNMTA